MNGPEKLFESENHWVTTMGLSFPGERVVYRGKDLFEDLRDINWMGLLLYGITGRLFSEKQVRLFETMWTLSSSYPDPRLWNNRIASLGGTSRSTGALSIGAAIAVSEATIYGRRPDIRAIDFLIRSMNELKRGICLENIIEFELKKYRNLPGYGRPIVNTDERIGPLMRSATELGFDNGEFVMLAFRIEESLKTARRRMKMNVAVLDAALAADQGLTPREYYHYTLLCFSAGLIPCMIDSLEKPEGLFLPLRCKSVSYQGVQKRKWK